MEIPSLSSAAKNNLAAFVTSSSRISGQQASAAAPSSSDLSTIAEGPALGELLGQEQQFVANEWEQSGDVMVVGQPSVRPLAKGTAKIEISVCLDSSGIQIKDQSGAIVRPAQKAGTIRNRNIYVLDNASGAWRVVDHTFPSDPSC